MKEETGGAAGRRGGNTGGTAVPRWETVAIVAACVLVGWFYLWTVRTGATDWDSGAEQRDYYNLLIDGWLDGQLHMKVEVPEALLRLEDPYDPAQRPPGLGLHDASFYRGRYYVYFGAAPVVTLMLPFRVVTGMDLPLPVAVLVFTYGGFLASVGVWLAVRRRYFPDTRGAVVVAGVAVLGLATLGPVLLRRADMWELPIAAGYFFAMLTLGGVWRSVHAAGGAARARWLAAAGLALGLAVASRPTYLFAGPVLAVPLVAWWWRERRVPWSEAAHALAPLLAIGGAMAWHNAARFDDPLQFGQAYQFSLDYESKLPHFQAGYVPYNVEQHFFGAARWTRYFPFVRPPEFGPAPAGYTVHRGDVYGAFANLPVCWLALLVPLAWWRRPRAERGELGVWLLAVALLFAGPAAVMLSFFSALTRYQFEFLPAFMLLAAVGLLAAARWAGRAAGRVGAAMARVALVGVAAWSAVFGVLASFSYERLLETTNPVAARQWASVLNRIPAAWERLAGVEHGAVEMTVRLPAGRRGGEETLLAVGDAAGREWDRVFVRYEADGRVRIGMRHGDAPEQVSEPLALERRAWHRVWGTMGSLYPPATHPFFGDMTAERAHLVRRRLGVEVGETVVLEGYYRFGSGGAVRVGADAGFSGEVADVKRGASGKHELLARVSEAARSGETIRLRVRWPQGRTGQREPLVVTGRAGAADFLYVEYLDGPAVRIGFDHWGSPAMVSEALRVEFAAEHLIEVSLGSLDTVANADDAGPAVRRGRLRVAINGTELLAAEGEFYVAEPAEVWIGRNPVGGTSCGETFNGEIRGLEKAVR